MNTENNKIIAEFMGSNYINEPYTDKEGITHDFYYWTKPSCNYPKSIGIGELSTAWQIGNFHFHDSWDWLMEVVEKIEITSFNITKTKPYLRNKDRFKGTTSLCGEFIIRYDDREEFKEWTSYISLGTIPSIIIKDFENRFNTKIEAYYNACVEFIKWYNQQK